MQGHKFSKYIFITRSTVQHIDQDTAQLKWNTKSNQPTKSWSTYIHSSVGNIHIFKLHIFFSKFYKYVLLYFLKCLVLSSFAFSLAKNKELLFYNFLGSLDHKLV